MRFLDLLLKKRNGEELSSADITEMVAAYVKGDIPDYQMAAFCMAVYFQGMSPRETADLTLAMAHSGDAIDLSAVPGVKVDKHSTGGVGDKTTLVLCPLVAACGVPIAKMSGRGLGHTGGTLDKLASIPGLSTALTIDQFVDQVRNIGLSVAGQTGDLAPADKRLYALRDVTATVDSIPLIASSIMSKKLAAGADAFVLDVKVGVGAFMSTEEQARELAELMVSIGKDAGKNVVAYLTQMDQPLGYAVGNSLEVIEAVETLQGRGPSDLVELCTALGAEMLVLGGKAETLSTAKEQIRRALSTGAGFRKLIDMVKAQGGDPQALHDFDRLPQAGCRTEITAPAAGYLQAVNARAIGTACMQLGAGRQRKEDAIDLGAGVVLKKKRGDVVSPGETLAVLFSRQEPSPEICEQVRGAFTIGPNAPRQVPLVIERIG